MNALHEQGRYVPRVEALEDRSVPSVNGLLNAVTGDVVGIVGGPARLAEGLVQQVLYDARPILQSTVNVAEGLVHTAVQDVNQILNRTTNLATGLAGAPIGDVNGLLSQAIYTVNDLASGLNLNALASAYVNVSGSGASAYLGAYVSALDTVFAANAGLNTQL